MKKLLSFLLPILLLIGLLPSAAFAAYPDVPAGYWGRGALERWQNYEIIRPDAAGRALPDQAITRGEFAYMLDQILRYQTATTPNPFSDLVNTGDPDYMPMLRANRADVLRGVTSVNWPGQTRAQAASPITRQEAATMFCRAFKVPFAEGGRTSFKDDANIDAWAKGACEVVQREKLMEGWYAVPGDTVLSFMPKTNLTRAQAVTVINRFVRQIASSGSTFSQNLTGTDKGNLLVYGNGSAATTTIGAVTIEGNVYIAPGVAEGNVVFNGTRITGTVYVMGGGVNSVHFNNGASCAAVESIRVDGRVSLRTDAATTLTQVNLHSGGGDTLLYGRFTNVHAVRDASYPNQPVRMTNYGTITRATVDESGLEATFAGTQPAEIVLAPNASVLLGDAGLKNTGSSNASILASGMGPLLTGVTLNTSDNRTLTLTFDKPINASNVASVANSMSRSSDGVSFTALSATERNSVNIGGSNNSVLTVTLDTPVVGSANRLLIGADVIRDVNNIVQRFPIITKAFGTGTIATGAPAVSAYSPLDNATNANLTANLQLTFNKRVEKTLNSGRYLRIYYRTASNGAWYNFDSYQIYNDSRVTVGGTDNRVVTITHNAFQNGYQYYITVDSGAFRAYDGGGEYMGFTDQNTWNFTAGSGTFYVSAFTPKDEVTGVSASADLQLTFNKRVEKVSSNSLYVRIYERQSASYNWSTLQSIRLDSSDITVGGTNNTVVSIKHSAFRPNYQYYVTVDSGAFRAYDNWELYGGVNDQTTWNFTAGSSTLTVAAYSPAVNASVSSVSTLSLTFNERINVSASSGKYIRVYRRELNSSTSASGTLIGTYDASTSTNLRITGNNYHILNIDTGALSSGYAYYVTVDSGAVRSYSNGSDFAGITGTSTWYFSVGNATITIGSPTTAEQNKLVAGYTGSIQIPVTMNGFSGLPTLYVSNSNGSYSTSYTNSTINANITITRSSQTGGTITITPRNTTSGLVAGSFTIYAQASYGNYSDTDYKTFTVGGNGYVLTVTGGGTNATQSGQQYQAGATVTINAGTAPAGKTFDKWTVSPSSVILANVNSSTTNFTMPSSNVTVTASFKNILYTLTLEVNGNTKTTSDAVAGQKYPIEAPATNSSGNAFVRWSTSGGGEFDTGTARSTNFTMPANNVTVTAIYETAVTVTNVSVSPSSSTVLQGGTQQFSATVTGTGNPSQNVTWTVTEKTSNSTVFNGTTLTVGADETASTLTVRATSTVDTNQYGTATVTVQAATPPEPTYTGVLVSPMATSVTKGGTASFSATVQGTNNPEQTVNWSLVGSYSSGTFISNGSLTVGSDETAQQITVRATSTVNTSASGTATITVSEATTP